MPLVYDTEIHNDKNLWAGVQQVLDYTMTRDGQVRPVVLMSSLPNSGDTFTMFVETLDGGSNSLGTLTYTHAKNPSDATHYRLQFDQAFFLPSGYRVKVSINATNSGSTAVDCTSYLFDPNAATDLLAVEGQSLGSKVGDNFNTLFQDGGNTSAKVLADLVSASDVYDEVTSVVNDDMLIDGKTIVAALKIISAVVAGKVSGAGTGTEVFRSLNDAADRVTVTVNAEGNRTAVTYS
jgi:hypothetical protein